MPIGILLRAELFSMGFSSELVERVPIRGGAKVRDENGHESEQLMGVTLLDAARLGLIFIGECCICFVRRPRLPYGNRSR